MESHAVKRINALRRLLYIILYKRRRGISRFIKWAREKSRIGWLTPFHIFLRGTTD